MPDQLQLRGGTTVQHSTFTGASKEVTIDTTKKTAVIHDGSTAGGNPLMREDGSNSALALGSAGTPSLKFTGDTNTGIYSPGADQVAISTNGTGRLFVNASGSVGINTASITTVGSSIIPLEIKGNATDRSGALVLSTSDLSAQAYSYIFSNVYRTGTGTNHDSIFITNNTERLRITSAGLVGIGTSSPGTLLSLSSSNSTVYTSTGAASAPTSGSFCGIANTDTTSGASSLQVFSVAGASGTSLIYHGAVGGGGSATGQYVIGRRTGTSSYAESLRIDSSGRVGIGSTAPQGLLHLAGSGASLYFEDTSSSNTLSRIYKSGSSLLFNSRHTSAGQFVFNSEDSAGVVSERARIDTSGRLLVGTSSTSANTRALFQATSANSAGSGNIYLARGSVPADGADLGAILFSDNGHAGSSVIYAARDGGTWTSGSSQPTRLVFSVTGDGSASPTEALRITNDRYVRLASGTGGIQFNGDTAAANALDDYEEGTWTPVLAGSTTAGTYETTFASGWYTKIGRQVTIQFRINLAGSITGGGAGFAIITGLPFNTSTDNYANGGSVLLGSVDFNDTAKHLYLYKRSTTSAQLVISEIFDNAAPQDVGIADFAASSIIAGSLVYFIS